MTANQINYFKAREDQRHNLQSEVIERSKAAAASSQAESAAKQAATAESGMRETIRHNQQQEQINWFAQFSGFEETRRHNQEQERLSAMDAETRRLLQQQGASLIAQQIKSLQLDSESRTVSARAAERSAQASILNAYAAQDRANAAMQSALASQISGVAALRNVDVRAGELFESTRHALASETEVARHNRMQESVARSEARSKAVTAAASATQAEAAQSRAASERIKAVSSAVNSGVNVVHEVSELASKLAGSVTLNKWIAGRRFS